MAEIISRSIYEEGHDDQFPLLEQRVLAGIRISRLTLPDYSFNNNNSSGMKKSKNNKPVYISNRLPGQLD